MKIIALLLIALLSLSLSLFHPFLEKRRKKEKDRHPPLSPRIETVLGPLIVIALDIYCSRDNTVLTIFCRAKLGVSTVLAIKSEGGGGGDRLDL